MKTSELTGADLDYWVAKAQGGRDHKISPEIWRFSDGSNASKKDYHPSTNWAQCGELIEKFELLVFKDTAWTAQYGDYAFEQEHGETPQEAIGRAVVASVFGDTVGVGLPDGKEEVSDE